MSHSPRRVVLPEAATDEVALRAVALLLGERRIRPLVLGRRQDLASAAEVLGIDIHAAAMIHPADCDELERIVSSAKNVLSAGMTLDHLRADILQYPFLFAAGLVRIGRADAVALLEKPPDGLLNRGLDLSGNARALWVVDLEIGKSGRRCEAARDFAAQILFRMEFCAFDR